MNLEDTAATFDLDDNTVFDLTYPVIAVRELVINDDHIMFRNDFEVMAEVEVLRRQRDRCLYRRNHEGLDGLRVVIVIRPQAKPDADHQADQHHKYVDPAICFDQRFHPSIRGVTVNAPCAVHVR